MSMTILPSVSGRDTGNHSTKVKVTNQRRARRSCSQRQSHEARYARPDWHGLCSEGEQDFDDNALRVAEREEAG